MLASSSPVAVVRIYDPANDVFPDIEIRQHALSWQKDRFPNRQLECVAVLEWCRDIRAETETSKLRTF